MCTVYLAFRKGRGLLGQRFYSVSAGIVLILMVMGEVYALVATAKKKLSKCRLVLSGVLQITRYVMAAFYGTG
jgi:hypothetical protein